MIRKAKISDIDRLGKLCADFSDATEGAAKYDPEYFFKTWSAFIPSGAGVIFILDDFKGMIGAVAFNDPNCGEITVTEMFWWVDPEHRGGGLKLLYEYEKWAEEIGAKRSIMVHLENLTPDRIGALYERRGYRKIETHYLKEL